MIQFSQAGRHLEFDSLASKFFLATGAARDAIYKEATVLAAKVGPAASHYVRVMEKVASGKEDYIVKESKRYVLCHWISIFIMYHSSDVITPSVLQPRIYLTKAGFGSCKA